MSKTDTITRTRQLLDAAPEWRKDQRTNKRFRDSLMIKQYSVIADPETGEWLTEPQYVKEVDVAEWDKLEDTSQVHYDCFEQCWACERAAANGLRWHACECTSETRAIEMRWA